MPKGPSMNLVDLAISDNSMSAQSVRMSRMSKRVMDQAATSILSEKQQVKQLTMAQQLEEAQSRLKKVDQSLASKVVGAKVIQIRAAAAVDPRRNTIRDLQQNLQNQLSKRRTQKLKVESSDDSSSSSGSDS